MKVLYITDLHGDEKKYKKSLAVALEQGIDVIVNGGDMLPKLGNRYEEQPEFIRGFLREYFKELQEHDITYLTMLGNDDLAAVADLFGEVCGEFENIHNIAGKKVAVGGYEFIGMNDILDHPFGCKDWVVTETRYVPQMQLMPYALLSTPYGYQTIHDWFDYAATELPYMCNILKELPEPTDAEKAVYVMHMPPAGMRLGQLLSLDRDIGSADIYDFLAEKQPLLSLHGHIHEAPETAKGTWINRIGRTTCIQPGQKETFAVGATVTDMDYQLVYAVLDLDCEEYERSTAPLYE